MRMWQPSLIGGQRSDIGRTQMGVVGLNSSPGREAQVAHGDHGRGGGTLWDEVRFASAVVRTLVVTLGQRSRRSRVIERRSSARSSVDQSD